MGRQQPHRGHDETPHRRINITHALTRHVHALGGRVVAVDFVRDDYVTAERRWEGIPIKCVRRSAAIHLEADVVVTTSLALDVVNWAAAHCEGRYCAMCHDYSGAPWGPFGHVDAKQRAPLRDALAGWNLLCDSKHVTAYHERFGPANVTPRLCYGACYGYFRAPPLYRHAVAAEYMTLISPCAPKGLSILAAIAPRLPQVKFLCVATAWTNAVVQHILKRFPNVVVEAGAPDVDVFTEGPRCCSCRRSGRGWVGRDGGRSQRYSRRFDGLRRAGRSEPRGATATPRAGL